MSTIDSDLPELEVPDELTSLKARADLLGISYHPSIGVEKLREKINAKLNDEAPVAEAVVPAKSENEKRLEARRDAARLIRIRLTCMNPLKKEWEGEIFTAGNSVVGTYKRFVPFNAEDGWHVENILLKQIQQRQCQVFTTVKDSRGNKSRKGKLIKEFAVEILPPLTERELKELAQRQAMAAGGGL